VAERQWPNLMLAIASWWCGECSPAEDPRRRCGSRTDTVVMPRLNGVWGTARSPEPNGRLLSESRATGARGHLSTIRSWSTLRPPSTRCKGRTGHTARRWGA